MGGKRGRQPESRNGAFLPVGLFALPVSGPDGQLPGAAHADGDALAVADPEIAEQLDRMAEGVAVVQQRADSGFALVGFDHLRLEFAGAADERDEPGVVRRDGQRFGFAFEFGEERLVEDDAGLENLGQSAEDFAEREGGEEIGVDGTRSG
jgi:hypothetical protein